MVRATIKDTGFEELAWLDETSRALLWHQQRLAKTLAVPSPHLHLPGRLRASIASLLSGIIPNKLGSEGSALLQVPFARPLMTTARSWRAFREHRRERPFSNAGFGICQERLLIE